MIWWIPGRVVGRMRSGLRAGRHRWYRCNGGWLSVPLGWVRSMDPAYDEAKFTELLLYVAERLQGDRAGGATKLNKVIFFAEFTHVRRHGAAISGCEFQKLDHGPAPRQLVPVRKRLVASGDAELREEDFLGRTQHRLVPLRPVDLSVFTEDERKTIDDVVDQLAGLTAAQVSDLSHEEPGWRLTDIGETIPCAAALLGARQVSTPTTRRVSRELAARAFGDEPQEEGDLAWISRPMGARVDLEDRDAVSTAVHRH